MVRRLLLPVLLAGLGIAGAASAALVSGKSILAPARSAATARPCAATASSAPSGNQPPATTPAPDACGTAAAAPLKPAAPPVPPALLTSSAASALVITGHGWGHGIGMSQWGADGYAQHGWSYRRILGHYYPGTTVAAGPSPTVRVLLVERRRRVALRSDSSWRVIDGSGAKLDLPAGKLIVPASLVVAGRTLTSPLTFATHGSPVGVGKKLYRGTLVVVSNGKRLQVVNAVGLEAYIGSVVGSEVPSAWPAAALEAQAVAARTFAVGQLQTVGAARAFDVYGDTRSQVYGGIEAESPAVTQAVAATARQVVLYGGKIAVTYFSASSGGRTVSAAEATGTPVPYLVSVADPYDTLSPYHSWGPVVFGASKVAEALGLAGHLIDLQTTVGPSGHVVSVTAVGSTARLTSAALTAPTARAAPTVQLTLTGAEVRGDLALRSTWFQVGWLTLAPPAQPVVFGASTRLTGIARGVAGVTLEARVKPAGWQTVGAVAPDAAGAFSIGVRPQATTQYRLATGNVRAALIKVRVVPVVTAVLGAGLVQGTVRPAPGKATAVEVERQDGRAWTTVAVSTTDAAGSFVLATRLGPGTYRVRCAPGDGLSAGASPHLLVVS